MSAEKQSKSPFLKEGKDGLGLRTLVIPETDNYQEVTVKYRPIRADDLMELHRLTEAATKSGQPMDLAQWEILARQITGWNIFDVEGNAVPITADNMRYLAAQVYTTISMVIIDIGDVGEQSKNLKMP